MARGEKPDFETVQETMTDSERGMPLLNPKTFPDAEKGPLLLNPRTYILVAVLVGLSALGLVVFGLRFKGKR